MLSYNKNLYISGQIAIDPETNEMNNASVEEEVKQIMENIKAILNEADMDFSNVVKATVYMTDLNDYKDFNAVYSGYFKTDFPAREAVEVARLP